MDDYSKIIQKKAKKTKIAFFLLSIFIVSGLSFFIGVMVGKEAKEKEIKKELVLKNFLQKKNKIVKKKTLPTAKKEEKEKKKVKPEKSEKSKDVKFTFFEKLPKEEKIKEETLSPSEKKKEIEKEKIPEKKSITEKKKEIKPSTSSIPSSKTIKKAGKIFIIQVGAFRNKSWADKLTQKLKQKGYNAYIKDVKSGNNKHMYKVRIGFFNNYTEAIQVKNNIKEKEKLEAIILKKE
ncbi:MAG: SPOR domain-containing protein [Deltaproteobacteria bacterium]|nr:SPOR domain-containing protein [Deltaproteobacteria bacterium]